MANDRPSRRAVIGGVVLGTGAAGLAVAAPQALRKSDVWQPDRADPPQPELGTEYKFFTADESALVGALVDRIIPPDDLGPGAHEAGVTFFLDRQLAGDFGRAQSMYMAGPWPQGTESQGYQTRLTPAGLYRTAIPKIDAYSRARHGAPFTKLRADKQDAVVQALEDNAVDLGGAPRATFFKLLLQNVAEGYFSDPLYGGNRNMAGWKMLGFPGARYNYLPYVKQHNKRLDLEPVGIAGGPAWTVKT